MSRKPSVYVAGPLFTPAERALNREIKNAITEWFNVYLPQEDGGLVVDMLRNGIPWSVAARRVFALDIEAINTSDYVLVVLDGRTVDEGAAFELGFAFARGKRCLAYQSDVRRLLPLGNNPMIDGAIEVTFGSPDELRKWAKRTAVSVEGDVHVASQHYAANGTPARAFEARASST